jgi:uncharacterized protein YegP (UPF0339 family)
MAARKAKIEKFQSKDGFRWRLVARNGKIIANNAEAYSSVRALNRAVESVRNAFRFGIIEVMDKDLLDKD